MKYRVYVDGQEGTTGLRIHEYLARRDDLELLRIAAERRKDAAERARLLNSADVAFLCLPDAASREAAALLENPATCLIDASSAHRTAPGWTYALPELGAGQRDAMRASKRLSNPGCHATGFILLVRPLVDAGLIEPAQGVSATSLTGFSGGGKQMIEDYESAQRRGERGRASADGRLDAPRPYGLGLSHKHLPEMTMHGGLTTKPVFMPVVGSFYKGLAVSVPLHFSQMARGASADRIHAAYAERYESERFVRVVPPGDARALDGGFFDVQACNDTNRVDLFVFADAVQAIVVARLDNLGKGASGAAVQAMNVHLGLDEALGL